MTNRASAQAIRITNEASTPAIRSREARLRTGLDLVRTILEEGRKRAGAYVRLWNVPGGGE